MRWSLTSAILVFASFVTFTLAAFGFRSGVMYGSAVDLERQVGRPLMIFPDQARAATIQIR
jgi:hypothetical protein